MLNGEVIEEPKVVDEDKNNGKSPRAGTGKIVKGTGKAIKHIF